MNAPQRASEPAVSADRACPIRLPGSQRTFEAREVLRGMGLRWDPATHAWHGRLPAARRTLLERQFGLIPQVVVPIEAFPVAPPALPARPAPSPPRAATSGRGVPRDYARTRLEARLAFPGGGEDAEPVQRRFSLRDVTSGLPDDSREEDERQVERRLRDLRGRVKAARGAISAVVGAREVLEQDPVRSSSFYTGYGITETMFRHGVPGGSQSFTNPRALDAKHCERSKSDLLTG